MQAKRAKTGPGERKLLNSVKKRPYDIRIHRKLSDFYLSTGDFLKAEQEQEIMEYLSRIRRMYKYN